MEVFCAMRRRSEIGSRFGFSRVPKSPWWRDARPSYAMCRAVTDPGGKKADDLSTIISPMRQPPPEALASFVVQVVEGPDRGASLTIDASAPSRALVGKSAICQLCLKDPKVSRRHLAVDVTGDALRLVDLGSTNGSFVSGVRFVEVLVEGQGELVRLGDSVLRIARIAP